MRNLLLLAVALMVFQKWDSIERYLNPPPDFSSAHSGKVVLYATEWCGYCQKSRELMREHNIPFYEYDIDKSREGRSQYDRLGGRGVPVLLVNGEVIHGYNAKKILKAFSKIQDASLL
ncbi:glutaredoxin family protein [Microbulbifer echini]|uniref:Glutaredoxin family protein n=1 Tax=Microbulbifer echini TaxID=1529067 RepID=A0ABV4NSJ7_9GAMM|nr:glutaredoxin family protein [uncultured Microbulbifer sp.]